jgi:hypothetical protein
MFEAEVEMEKRSSFLPLVLMMCLVAAIVGLVSRLRATPGPGENASHRGAGERDRDSDVARIRSGHHSLPRWSRETECNEKPGDPNYQLLEKAGIVKLAKVAQGRMVVSITPGGERLMAGLPGFKKFKEADGTFLYQAPLAQRQFVSNGKEPLVCLAVPLRVPLDHAILAPLVR